MLKKDYPGLLDTECYMNWATQKLCPPRTITQTPFKGDDGMYHFLYETRVYEKIRDGSVKPRGTYYGQESTANLNDGYVGSGIEILKMKKENGKFVFKRTELEFFNTSVELLKAEAQLVTADMVAMPNVLNSTQGGDSSRHYSKSNIPPGIPTKNGKEHWPFSMLDAPPGTVIESINGKDIRCTVFDNDHVIYVGHVYELWRLTQMVFPNQRIKNPLPYWTNLTVMKNLLDILSEKKRAILQGTRFAA